MAAGVPLMALSDVADAEGRTCRRCGATIAGPGHRYRRGAWVVLPDGDPAASWLTVADVHPRCRP